MNEIKRKESYLKESRNPINKESEKDQTSNMTGNQRSIDILAITTQKKVFEDTKKTSTTSECYLTDNNPKERENKIELIENGFVNKKDRYKLEKKMKIELENNYNEFDIKNNLKNNSDLFKEQNNIKEENNKINAPIINEINKNKTEILKQLIIIQITILFLLCFNSILYNVLNKAFNSNNMYLCISSLSLSGALSFFTLFLIALILLGIFQSYYTSNIFRFLCLLNFCISISLFIIHFFVILQFYTNINTEIKSKLKKIFIYILIFSIASISIIVNVLIGIIAKDSFLIICGCKNENACRERRIKRKDKKSFGGKYVLFNEEYDDNKVNVNLKKFHACIHRN